MRWRVQQGLSALSSDGLSNFGIPEDNAAALDAIRHYFDQYIPMVVAEQLLQSESKWSEAQSGGTLTVTLHKHGVNLRHLGRVFNLVAESAAGAEIKAALRSVLLKEMTRRSLKVLMLQARRSQGNDETVDLCRSITIDQVLSTLTLKYPDLLLTDSDRQYITHTVLARPEDPATSTPAGATNVWLELTNEVNTVESDLVMAPDFPTMEEAEDRLQSELTLRSKAVGGSSPALLRTMCLQLQLYMAAHSSGTANATRRENGEKLVDRMISIADSAETQYVWVYTQCAIFWNETGHNARALPLFERALRLKEAQLGERSPQVIGGLCNLATAYKQNDDYVKAEQMYVRALTLQEEAFGENSRYTGVLLNNLANLYSDQEHFDKAEPLYERALKVRKLVLGKRSPEVAKTLLNMGNMYSSQGKYSKAEQMYSKALKLREEVLGEKDPDTMTALSALASLYSENEHYVKAEPLFERLLKLQEAALGPDHPDLIETLQDLGNVFEQQEEFEKALPYYLRALRLEEADKGVDHTDIATACNNLGTLYVQLDQPETAIELFERALKIWSQSLPADHPDIIMVQDNMRLVNASSSEESEAE